MPVVLTHTCPLRYKPLEALKPDLDQSTIDCTTELWMDAIESRLRYDHWFCGHFHTDKQIDNLQILFQTFVAVPVGRLSTRSSDEIGTCGRSRAPPLQGAKQIMKSMQKGADQQIRSAPSIYSSCSTTTSYKFDTSVSGGAYQDARKVSLVWNDSQKLGPHLNSEAGSTQTVTQRPFFPLLFRQDGKEGAAEARQNRPRRNEPRYSRSLFSSEPVSSFSNRKLNLRFDFLCKFVTTSQSACG